MASTHFETGVVITSDWLNDVDDAVYNPISPIIPATAIVNIPTSTIAATNVQAAIDELDAEKQPLDVDLTAIAALSTTAYGRALLEVASEAALKVLINLEAGVDYQAYNVNIPTVAPGTSGNILTSTGTTWESQAFPSGNVAVLTGTLSVGGTIPLPPGFIEEECKWIVSFSLMSNSEYGYYAGQYSIYMSGRTVIHINNYFGEATVNYLIIGVK